MSRITTRQIKIPLPQGPVTAKHIKNHVKRQMTVTEKLVRVALTSVESDHMVIEAGIQHDD
jgi:hypothetical protein